jgi:hypothetical protein
LSFLNDCTDGTDTLLDHLDARGDLTLLPNPGSLFGRSYSQPAALSFVQTMPVFRAADFMLPIDVDEFVNIRTGDGTLQSLFGKPRSLRRFVDLRTELGQKSPRGLPTGLGH